AMQTNLVPGTAPDKRDAIMRTAVALHQRRAHALHIVPETARRFASAQTHAPLTDHITLQRLGLGRRLRSRDRFHLPLILTLPQHPQAILARRAGNKTKRTALRRCIRPM